LELSDGGADDETFDTVELTIIPPAESTPLSLPATAGAAAQTEAQKLFEAISECSNLNPDPVSQEDEDDDGDDGDGMVFEGDYEAIEGFSGVFRGTADGGLPPPLPGSSGWITAENVGEYFDEEGNWIGNEGASGELGEGAGHVRGRDEAQAGGANGHSVEDEGENKRPRTE
jgi:nucleotide-sensitive chloride channel 1A